MGKARGMEGGRGGSRIDRAREHGSAQCTPTEGDDPGVRIVGLERLASWVKTVSVASNRSRLTNTLVGLEFADVVLPTVREGRAKLEDSKWVLNMVNTQSCMHWKLNSLLILCNRRLTHSLVLVHQPSQAYLTGSKSSSLRPGSIGCELTKFCQFREMANLRRSFYSHPSNARIASKEAVP